MATLIPALSTCLSRMTAGEKRLAERLERKLDDDYLLWWDVPIGPRQTHPDFVVLHPHRGALILETKDWHPSTILSATRERFEILDNATSQPKVVINPLAQARHCAIQVITALQQDPQLLHGEGPHKGKLAFPWGYGVVFTRITRAQFEAAELHHAIPERLVICQDEMFENVDPEAFQERLWNMFHHSFGRVAITLPQLDRIRWILFPQVRIPQQADLFADESAEAAAENAVELGEPADAARAVLVEQRDDPHQRRQIELAAYGAHQTRGVDDEVAAELDVVRGGRGSGHPSPLHREAMHSEGGAPEPAQPEAAPWVEVAESSLGRPVLGGDGDGGAGPDGVERRRGRESAVPVEAAVDRLEPAAQVGVDLDGLLAGGDRGRADVVLLGLVGHDLSSSGTPSSSAVPANACQMNEVR